MVTYEDALKEVLYNIPVLEAEEKPLFKCAGQVLAEDIYPDCCFPQTDISGPDGYAVQSADLKRAGRDRPVRLRIIGTVRAGRLPKRALSPGTAMRIMTGAVVPRGADCVVRFEDTDEPENKNGPNPGNPKEVKIYVSVPSRGNIRPAGSSIEKGARLLPKGTVMGPAQISTLASVGKSQVRVIRQPVVAVIATGDELIDLGRPLSPGKAYNCNTAAISSLITYYGGKPKVLGIARDRKEDLRAKISKGMDADLIITSGGVSKGDYDLVRLVMDGMGKVIFSKIRMGPGASVALGIVKDASSGNGKESIPLFGLSGPPPGCLINFETLVRPALLRMRGIQDIDHPVVEALALDSVAGVMPMTFVRWTYLEKRNGQFYVRLNVADDVGILPSIATANSLTMIPPKGTSIREGDKISVWPLDWRRPQFLPAYL